ncbi:glycosyltransferase [Flavobacterium sp.]
MCFVNDGSTDNTLAVLNSIRETHPGQVHILSLTWNRWF